MMMLYVCMYVCMMQLLMLLLMMLLLLMLIRISRHFITSIICECSSLSP